MVPGTVLSDTIALQRPPRQLGKKRFISTAAEFINDGVEIPAGIIAGLMYTYSV